MRKNLGKKTYLFPMPVLIIGTFNEDGTPNAMNVAWGTISDYNQVEINLAEHQTTDNINRTKAFTVTFADKEHMVEADYVGIVSGAKVKDKVARAHLNYEKSEFVNAPIFTDFSVTLECELEVNDNGRVLGNIVNVVADEKVLDENGNIDIEKMHLIAYDSSNHYYVEIGKKVGKAFSEGKKIK